MNFTDSLTGITLSILIPLMIMIFCMGLLTKFVIYYMYKGRQIFIKEFEKRIQRHLKGEYEDTIGLNFSDLTNTLGTKTYYEFYMLRIKNKRRRFDRFRSLSDQLFMIEEGAQKLLDELKQQVIRCNGQQDPGLKSVVHYVMMSNPVFNYVFGIFNSNSGNHLLSILPGLFIITGIFGTFLGITASLPELLTLNPAQSGATNQTLMTFITKISYSINSSLVGIGLSIAMSVANALFSVKEMNRYSYEILVHGLEFLWTNSRNKPLMAKDYKEQEGVVHNNISWMKELGREKNQKGKKDVINNSMDLSQLATEETFALLDNHDDFLDSNLDSEVRELDLGSFDEMEMKEKIKVSDQVLKINDFQKKVEQAKVRKQVFLDDGEEDDDVLPPALPG